MKIILTNAAKRFNYEWVFRNMNLSLSAENTYALTGSNGSGKTTLLRILSGYSSLSDGAISWQKGTTTVASDKIFSLVAVASPASALIEEMSLLEQLAFHQQFKPFINNLTVDEVISILNLKAHQHKLLSQYSTGMKQRVKLALALLADSPIVLLDEPSSNLDAAAIAWMHDLIRAYKMNRLLIIASNDETDLVHCTERIHLNDYKN